MPQPALPLLNDRLYLTDSGLETTLVFVDEIDLPSFAAFPLVETELGAARLRRYYLAHAAIAQAAGAGFVLESPTWRASAGWGAEMGYTPDDLERVNRTSIRQLESLRRQLVAEGTPCLVSGCIGPEGDGYAPATVLSANEAQRYHAAQVRTFADTTADMVSAMTLTYAEEAIGIARAAADAGIPCVLSFTVETDGRLPSGESLGSAIQRTDAATGGSVAYYMINCAHPTHFAGVLQTNESWLSRIRGIRANASCLSHAELDNATELDAGNPQELGSQYTELLALLPELQVLGGCCGTDERHVHAIAEACAPRVRQARRRA